MAALSAWLFQVETANRSLEEMDVMVEGKTMWPSLDRDLTRVHPMRDVLKEDHLKQSWGRSRDEWAIHIYRVFRT